jgi:hypothetical protein
MGRNLCESGREYESSGPKPQSLAALEAPVVVHPESQRLRSLTRCKCSKIRQSVAVRPQLSNSEGDRRNLRIYLDRSVLPSNKLSNKLDGSLRSDHLPSGEP